MRISLVRNQADLSEAWPMVLPMLIEGIKYTDGKYITADIWLDICKQDKQLWLVYTDTKVVGCIVTEILCYPQEKRLGLFLVAGVDFDDWFPLRVEIYLWAKDYGCKACEFYGRKGWVKKLENHFTLTHVCMKEVIK